MTNDALHPALSAEFLSRLHDGELDAAERAHFESHRAHCADCRSAAAAFETALSLFRASTTSPPPPDLAARILRKLGTGKPRRSPFGTVFGINLKWAAASAMAVIAVILGSAVVFQRSALRKVAEPRGPIPVILGTPATPRQAPPASQEAVADRPSAKAAVERPRKELPPPPPPAAPPASVEEKGASSAAPRYAPAPEGGIAPAEPRAAETRADETAPRAARMMAEAPSQTLRGPDAAGGEGARTTSEASPEPGAPARLVVVPLDGQGNAPVIVSSGAAELLSDLRGRQFLLLVEAGGRVRDARAPEKSNLKKHARGRDSEGSAGAPPSVWNLRFSPTDRARRLLLRVE